MMNVGDVSRAMGTIAPLALAADWDNVGLLLGDPNDPVERIMTCLTVTPEVVSEAVSEKVDMIVSHHPILFRGAKKLSNQSVDGRIVWPLARAGIAVYSPHTAFDNATGGINDWLAAQIGVADATPLRRRSSDKKCKIVVFVPDSDLTKVSDAIFAAGAGVIGQYEKCSFRLQGTGTFFGTETTNPVVGQRGRLEQVPEWRLEVVCPEPLLGNAIAAMRSAHSYEEVAFDVYPLHPVMGSGGEGRVGNLTHAVALGDLARRMGRVLGNAVMQVVGDCDRQIGRVAVACGAAGEFLNDAIRAGADLFVTGEMRFHDYLSAQSQGIALLVTGHYASERPAVEALATRLAGLFPTIQVWASKKERDPVQTLERSN